jgi:hypothetical protein
MSTAADASCAPFADPLTERLAAFVRGLGIPVHAAVLDEKTFLPGLDIRDGALFIDEARLKYPGDILHEAGHLAVTDPALRNAPTLATPDGGDEMTAIAWSYAALRHLDIDPAIVFHAGYKNDGSPSILENFTAGNYFGVPLLQLYGMSAEPRHAEKLGRLPFPTMLRWLR